MISDESHIKSLACRWSGPSYWSPAIGKQGGSYSWVKEGETSSAYFFCLEKKRGADRWISALRGVNSSIVSSPDDLFHSLSSFYSSLFTSSPTDPVAQQELPPD